MFFHFVNHVFTCAELFFPLSTFVSFVVPPGFPDQKSRRYLTRVQVVLRRYSESIRNAIEERKHCDYVHCFGNLFFAPSCIPKLLHIFVRGTRRGLRNQLRVFEQSSLTRR
jgi:hypothetical protein